MFDTVWFGWKQNARLKQGEEKFLSASVVCLNSRIFDFECQWRSGKLKIYNRKAIRNHAKRILICFVVL